MNFTRNGKIARLPKPIRDELNLRLDKAESGPKLAHWLNELSGVKQILADHFAGRPINNQNISEWRNGGYQDYLQVQEDQLLNRQLTEHAEGMEADPATKKISETFAAVTAAEFVRASRVLLKETTDPKKRWEAVRDIQRELIRLRREDYRANHLKIRQEKWTHQFETDKALITQAAFTEERRQMLAYFQLKPELKEMSRKMGGDDKAWDHAAFLLELQHNLKIGFLERKGPFPPPPPSTPSAASATSANPPRSTPTEDIADNSTIRHPESGIRHQAPIKPQTPSKMPEIRVHQTLAESLNNPPSNPDSPRPTCRLSNDQSMNPPIPAPRTNVQDAKP